MTHETVASVGLERKRGLPLRTEWALLLAMLAVFIVVNVATAARSPVVWQDEAMFADPAINAVTGHGFTSTAWRYQRANELWGGNAPLYTMLLVPWLKIWGVSITAVRSINYLYMAIAAALAWIAVRRGGMVRTPVMRLALVALLLCENGIAFNYRCGRYDVLGIVWTCAALAAMTIRGDKARLAVLFACTFVMPITGIQLVAMAGVTLMVVLAIWKKRVWREVAAMLAGLAAGVIATYLLLHALGTWGALWDWVTNKAPLTDYAMNQTPRSKIADLWLLIGGLMYLTRSPEATHDLSLLPIALAALVPLLMGRGEWKRLGWTCLAVMAALPVVLCVVGQFPSYYLWMMELPVTIAAAAGVERVWPAMGTPVKGLVALALVCAAGLGLPARLALTLKEWKQRDPRLVEAFTKKNLRAGDVVFADHALIYAMHENNAAAFYHDYLRLMTPEEKKAVTLIMTSPEMAAKYQAKLGGTWIEEDRFTPKAPGGYRLMTAYRRGG